MDKSLFAVALRYNAIYLPASLSTGERGYSVALDAFLRSMLELGYVVDEPLLRALSQTPADQLQLMAAEAKLLAHTGYDWTPLVKGWDRPTGESVTDHVATAIANLLPAEKRGEGVELPCGHFIPTGTFPIERYNGCPYCGRVFGHSFDVPTGGGSRRTILSLWTDSNLRALEKELLESPVPLDATQADSLRALVGAYGIDSSVAVPAIKETSMLCIDCLVESGSGSEASRYLSSATDILRYLWFKKTGKAYIERPADITARAASATGYRLCSDYTTRAGDAARTKKAELKLRYSRRMCAIVAGWLEGLDTDAGTTCEAMHPHRGMWVRVIRALRLAEYSRRKAYPRLREIIDRFYRSDYDVWAGDLEAELLAGDYNKALARLKSRPGAFARCLFATMLRAGSDRTLAAFAEVSGKVPMRLLVTLASFAHSYFTPGHRRTVRLRDGRMKAIGANPQTKRYGAEELGAMAGSVRAMVLAAASARYAGVATEAKTVYIDPALYDIPLPIGDRSETIHDKAGAMQGQRFKVEGDKVRLFMEWGRGLPASHLDMDLSCRIIYPDHTDDCAYYALTTGGATHSGDIQHIPDNTGAAEYIELDIPELQRLGARYAAFTCNAYTDGSLSPNMRVGWMDSAYPMTVDDATGVAYDPSTVSKAISIAGRNLAKGLLFGLLDVDARQIIWLEMPFTGQTVGSLGIDDVKSLLARLSAKISFGELLSVKAEAQHLAAVSDACTADEVYTAASALDPAVAAALL